MQVAALQEELDFTHAHYQKLIEAVGGPGWTANMGPLERTEGDRGGCGCMHWGVARVVCLGVHCWVWVHGCVGGWNAWLPGGGQ